MRHEQCSVCKARWVPDRYTAHCKQCHQTWVPDDDIVVCPAKEGR